MVWLDPEFPAPKSVSLPLAGHHLRQISPDDTEIDKAVRDFGPSDSPYLLPSKANRPPAALRNGFEDH